jgi:signal transduction histidine kinase
MPSAAHLRDYGVAAGAAAAALFTSHFVWPLIEPDRSPLPLFLAAVMVSAWYGGFGPGVLTTAIAVVTKTYFIMPPTGSFDIDDIATAFYIVVFVLVAVLISWLTGALRRAEAANRVLAARERAARAEAEAANRAKDVFLAKISHELRTPLQATSSWAHALGGTRHDERAFTQTVAALHRCIARQSYLIDDLLTASEIIGGKMRLNIEPVMLGPVIDAAVRTVMAAVPAPHAVVSVAADPSVGPVAGDRARLEQIVCNLLSNALKFTPVDGRVEVRLGHDGGSARLAVADNGRGIPAQMLARLFDEFWQAETRQRDSPVGLGLGLAIVRQLVQMHGGTVRAESPGPGYGATFVVELPLAGHDADVGVPSTVRAQAPTGG